MAKKRSSKKHRQPKRTKAKRRVSRTRATGRRTREFNVLPGSQRKGLGPESGGQSGDTQGLSRSDLADAESVEELVEEGQSFEASVVDAIENAPDPDQREVKTSETLEDDVPEEYGGQS